MIPDSDRELQDAVGRLRSLDRQSPDMAELCRHILELCGNAVVRSRNMKSEFERVIDFSGSCVDVFSKDVARFRTQISQWELRFAWGSDLGHQSSDTELAQFGTLDIEWWQDDADEFEALDACADIIFTRARLEFMKIGVTKLLVTSNCGQEQETVVSTASQLLDEIDTVLTTELNLRRLCRIVGLPLIRNLRKLVEWTGENSGSEWWVDRTLERTSHSEDAWERKLRHLLHTLRHDVAALRLERDQTGHIYCPAMEDVKITISGNEMLLEGDRFSHIVLGVGVISEVDRRHRKLQWTVELPQKTRLAPSSSSPVRSQQLTTMRAATGSLGIEPSPQRNWTLSVTTDWVNLLHEFDYETSVLHLATEAKYQVGFDWEVRHNKGGQQGQAWSSRTQAEDFPYRAEFSADFPEGADRLTITLTEFLDKEVLPSNCVSITNHAPVCDDGGTRLPISLTAGFDPGCDNPLFQHLQDPTTQLTLLCVSRSDVDSKVLDDEYNHFAAELEIRHSSSVLRILRAKGADIEDAEDAWQAAWMECMRRVRETGIDGARRILCSEMTERSYLSRLATRRWYDNVLRKVKRRTDSLGVKRGMDDAEPLFYNDSESTGDLCEDLALSEDDRVLIHMHFVDGYSLEEIAEIRNVKANTLRQRMSRLKRKIRDQLLENASTALSDSCREILKRASTEGLTSAEHAEWLRSLQLGNAAREPEAPEDGLAWDQLNGAQKSEWCVRSERTLGRAIKTLLSMLGNRE